jgi:cell fate regulator YaaT (PSP1 superfamily)
MVQVKKKKKIAMDDAFTILMYGTIDQAELFACIIKGEYTFDKEYWSDISDSGTIQRTRTKKKSTFFN